MTYTDPDFSGIDALPDPDGPTRLSATLEDLVGAIRSGRDGVNGTSAGVAPDKVVEVSGQAETAARDESTNAATRQAAARILKDAAAAWRKDAPKADVMNAADKKLADAETADTQARAALAACTTDEARTFMQPIVNSAATELLNATTNLQKVKAQRDAANKAFERARKQAAEKLASIKTVDRTGDGGGYGAPGTPGSTSTSTGAGAGSGNGRTASPGAGKPATPSMPTVGQTSAPAATKTSSDNKSTDPSALLSALSQNGQQGQGQQQATPQAQTQPAATQPQPQPQNQQDGKDKGDPAKTLQEQAERNSEQILAAAGITNPTVSPVTSHSSTPSTPAPVAQPTTALRPEFKPAPLTAAPAAQTTGTSQTGLTTPSDTSGRSTPTPGAFDTAKTATSAAHGTETNQGTQQQTTRPGGTGMPGMMPMAPGAAGPSYGSPAVKDKDGKVLSYGGNPQSLILNGWPALEETVRGGTICQALRQENQDLIRV